jgi:hypothetical protein
MAAKSPLLIVMRAPVGAKIIFVAGAFKIVLIGITVKGV